MEIKTFNYDMLDDLKYNPSIVLCSQRGGGKSFLLNSLMKKLDSIFHYSHIMAFSQTDKFTGQMDNFVPRDYIFETLEPLQKIIETRKKPIENIKDRKNICLIFNDIANLRESNSFDRNSKSIKNSSSLEYLFSLGRHEMRCTIIVLIQSLVMISPLARINSDITFFWTAKNSLVRKKIKEEYLGILNKKSAEELYNTVFDGTPYQCFVVNSWIQGTTRLEQFVFKFLAPEKTKKWKSKFVKGYNKIRKSKDKNKVVPNKKNNIFTIYNEIESQRIKTKTHQTRSKTKLKNGKLPSY